MRRLSLFLILGALFMLSDCKTKQVDKPSQKWSGQVKEKRDRLPASAEQQPAAKTKNAAKELGLRLMWHQPKLFHQREAHGLFASDSHVYVAGGGDPGQISKVAIADGSVVWSIRGQSTYQPSYPVSDGQTVVLGDYYRHRLIGLDDSSGQQKWQLDKVEQPMSAACFFHGLALIGAYDRQLHAIDPRSGAERYATKLRGTIWARPVIYHPTDDRSAQPDQQSLVLLGSQDGSLYALDPAKGTVVWRLDLGGTIHAEPLLVQDVAFLPLDRGIAGPAQQPGSELRMLLAIDLLKRKILARHQATERWRRHLTLAGDLVIAGDEGGRLVAFDRLTGRQVWETEVPRHLAPVPLLVGQTLWLPFNQPQRGNFQKSTTELRMLQAQTGKLLGSHERGGIVDTGEKWVLRREMLVSASHGLTGYRLAKP